MRTTVEIVTVTDSAGQSHVLPEHTVTLINNTTAARKPAVWKGPQVLSAKRAALSDSPALYFNPDRWLGANDRPDDADDKQKEVPAWHAFGAGGKAYPGRAFAEIEMMSMMATLSKDCSLDMIVDEKTILSRR